MNFVVKLTINEFPMSAHLYKVDIDVTIVTLPATVSADHRDRKDTTPESYGVSVIYAGISSPISMSTIVVRRAR